MQSLGKYPELVCGRSSFVQPLAPNNENAFNPCFVSWLYAAFSITFLVLSSTELAKLLKRRSNPTTWFGNLLPRNTGLNYYLRCNAVLIHTACYIGLSFGYLNLHARYADTKIVGFLLLNVLLLLVILPCHILEVAVLPTPSFVLQAFWPLLTILQIVLLYQDAFTKWPVLVGHQNSDPNVLFAIELFLVVNSISICVLESLQWKPTSKLIHEYKLQGLDWELEEPDLYSTLTFAWMNPLIKKAFVNKTLSMDELPDISHDLSAELSTTKLKHFYKPRVNLTKQGATWHLIKLLSLTFGPTVLLALVYELGSLALSFVQPQLLKQLINFFGSQENKSNRVVEQNDSILRGILIALSMFVITLIQTSFDNKFVLYYLRSGLGCRSSLTSLMFQKALKLSSESKLVKSTGDIVTLVSVDVDRIQQITQNIQTIIVAPIELTICLVSLYYMVGWKPALVSFGMLCFMVPLHSFIIRLAKKLRRQQMKYTDLRSRTINEILTSIKSIKLYSWESPMNERLQDVRVNQELKNLKKIRVVNVCGGFLWQILPFLLSFFTFATFVLTLEEPLTSEILFPTLSLLNMLSSPMVQFPMIIAQLVDSGVSVTRVAEFLELAEIDDDLIKRLPKAEENAEIAVEIKDTSFLWEKPVDPNNSSEDRITSVKYALKNINFTARKSYLHCIVGRVGSGKSTFFTSLLGQLEMVNSKDPLTKLPYVSIRGTIAYCAQQPWIMNSSLKDNILFGHKYDEGFYKKTIECCQLIPDISVLPDGDETFVGEKGISLSGGQKARLSLARAVYARSDVYLLDDILSAVDSHVGKQIIEKVLSRELGLLKTKTIILATNSLLVLNYSDSIDLLERGEIVESGKFNEIMSQKESNSKLFNLLSEFGKQGPSHPSSTVTPLASTAVSIVELESELGSVIDDVEDLIVDAGPQKALIRANSNATLEGASLAPFKWKSLSSMGVNGPGKTAQTVEKSAMGKVKWSVYWEYINMSSTTGAITWIVLLIGTSVFSVAANYWLKHWAEQNSSHGSNEYVIRYISVYAILGLTSSILSISRGILLWTYLAIRASKNIHDSMSKSLFRAPMLFFERTPIGRVMNRFTSDISKVDEQLPRAFGAFFSSLSNTLFTLGVIAVVIPPFILVVIILSFGYFHYQKYYTSISRELKRLVSVSRSPIYAHLQESLNGVDTIRAYQQFDRFKYLNDANLDFNLKTLYILRSSNRWLSTRLQSIGSLAILAASSLSILTLLTSSPLTSGTAGFVMTYALQTTSSLSVVVRMSAEVESTIVAYERCLEYCNLPVEEEENEGQYTQLPDDFPAKGSIKFNKFSTRYRKNLDLILRDISFEINGKEKIGVVGRTGAGKSSLTLSLFRIIEAVEGEILIDGIDISKLSVYDLRHHLLIIPQDSQAFEGTIRQNLDPLEEYSDDDIWKVLELANLKDHIKELELEQGEGSSGLDCKVAESGSNFSAGQLQLMCLARALLNKSKIIVLDEATASVDVQTDKIIQETIRTYFKDKTIITIAHRLDTVMDSDKILTLDHGEVKEFDSPKKLLENEEGIFYQLCKQGGYIK